LFIVNETKMTRAQLEAALLQLQAENSALRAQAAQASPAVAQALPASLLTPDQEQLVRLMQMMYSAVVLTDRTGKLVWANEGFSELCGLGVADVRGQAVGPLVRANLDNPAVLEYIQGSIAAQMPFQYEVRNPRPEPNAILHWLAGRHHRVA
jgi:PAS domain-containing protein